MDVGASKASAKKQAHTIIGMKEGLNAIELAIKTKVQQLSSSNKPDQFSELVGSVLTLEDLQLEESKLRTKLTAAVDLLRTKDATTGATVELAVKNELHMAIYKCKMLLISLSSKVCQALLAAVPIKRKVSRKKKGMWTTFDCEIRNIMNVNIPFCRHKDSAAH